MFVRESAAVYTEHNMTGFHDLIDLQAGQPAAVVFDFERVWDYYIRHKPDTINFVHVHPTGFGPGYSQQDLSCMRGFRGAFGKKQRWKFLIVCFQNDEPGDLRCQILEHLIEQESNAVTSFRPVRPIPIDILKALKLLSYGDVNNESLDRAALEPIEKID